MKSNKIMKITAAVMTAAMLAAAIPAAATASIGISAAQRTAAPTIVQEVFGDINGLYYDMGYTYSDGSYLIESPIPIGRGMKKYPFEFSFYYNSNSTADNQMGNGISCTYNQKLIRNSESSFTFIDEKGFSHEIAYDPYTGEASSTEGPVSLVINQSTEAYELTFGNDFDDFKKLFNMNGQLVMYFTNTDPYDAARVYYNEDGTLRGAVCKDTSSYLLHYETLADGSTRVSSIEYTENYSGLNQQIVNLTYDADGNLIDTECDSIPGFLRGYRYTYNGGKLASAYNKLEGGTLSVASDPAGNPVIQYQAR